MRGYLLFIVAIFCSLSSVSQGFSNKGKDFWVGYGYHVRMGSAGTGGSGLNGQNMVLYFATEEATTINISIPTLGYTQVLNSGAAPTVLTSAPLPKTGTQDARLLIATPGLNGQNKGIHITATRPVVAYAHIYDQNVSGATILFPTNTLGKEYYSINYNNVSNEDLSNCWFYFIATDTGTTTVEVTPSAPCIGHPANIPFTVTLTQGQAYNVMGSLNGCSGGGGGGGNFCSGSDLTGSKIRSIATGSSGCKRIAVFSGSGKLSINCTNGSSSADNYMVQAFPKDAWGKKFLTVPTRILTSNFYRIFPSDPSTPIWLNGLPITLPLINGIYYQVPQTPLPLEIIADEPIMVAQYITSQNACGNGSPGDPEVIYLSPVEQNISRVIWNATPNFNITQHYYNVVIPNTGTAISSFRLDGTPVPASLFLPHPQDASYSYLSQQLANSGVHIIESDSGFNAIAYGYGNFESYGYNAGTNIRDLYNKLEPLNPLSISQDAVACRGTSLYLSVTLPYQPTSLAWDFKGNPYQIPNNNVTVGAPVHDTTYFIGAKQVWRYKLPASYTFTQASSTPGYPITITAGIPTSEGCGNFIERDFDLMVYDPPNPNFAWIHNGCVNDTIRFADSTRYLSGTYSYQWSWNFGDGNSSAIHNSRHLYAAPGTYNVQFTTTTNVGCRADTSIAVTVYPVPSGNISGPQQVCLNAPSPQLTMAAVTGASPYVFNYTVNGGAVQQINSANDSVFLSVPTSATGPVSYNMTGIQAAGCYQDLAANPFTVTVNPLPSASIQGSDTVCQNAPSPIITFAGSGSTAPYTFSYNINGGALQTITTSSGNSVNLPVPTNIPGDFTYNLLNVTDGTATACSQVQSASVNIRIIPLPVASIQGGTSVCLNDTVPPRVIFTGASGIAPYVYTYSINGGPAQTITGDTVSIPVPTGTAGNFNYQLISVQESGSRQCLQLQNASAPFTIWPLPAPAFQPGSPACPGRTLSLTDQSAAQSVSMNSWSWDFADGTPLSTVQNPVHTYVAAGLYPVTLNIINSNGCRNSLTQNVIINPRPEAGFINPEVCLSDTYAQFNDTSSVSSGSIIQWLWNFGDPGSGALNTSTQTSPQHSYNSLGQKDITLIVTSNAGCSDTLNQSFFINGDLPDAIFQILNPLSLCANDSVSIRNVSTVNVGSIVKVEITWDFLGAPSVVEVDDVPFNGKVYTHLYPDFQSPATRSYRIKFRAFSGISCIDSSFQDIDINRSPNVLFQPISDTCRFITPFQITEASETGAVPGTYTFSGQGISAAGVFDPALTGPGQFNIEYVYTSDRGCRDSAVQPIRILQPPVANFGFSDPACNRQLITFSDSSSTSTAALATWNWNFADGSAPIVNNNNNSVTHTYSPAGPYQPTLTVTTAEGCNSLPATRNIIIHPNPVAQFDFSDTACLPNANISFINTSTIADGTQNTFTYSWNFGDAGGSSPNTSSAVNPSHIYSGLGPYTVNLRVVSGPGCVDDTSIVVNTIHPQPAAAFSFSAPGVCLGEQVQMLDQSDPRDGSTTLWQWQFGDGVTSSVSNPTYTYAAAGDYTVRLTITNSFGCVSSVAANNFTVYPYPLVDAGPAMFILEGYGANLQATASGNNLRYQWTPGTYLDNVNVMTPLCTPTDDILYELAVTGAGGCVSEDTVRVVVLKALDIPNTFTPNGDGINEKWEIRYLDYYPFASVQIFTRTGQLVYETKNGYRIPWDGTYKGNPLPVDTYYYIIAPGSGRKPYTGYVTILK